MHCPEFPACPSRSFGIIVSAMFTVETYELQPGQLNTPEPELAFDGLINETFAVECSECNATVDPSDDLHKVITGLLAKQATAWGATCEPLPVVYADGVQIPPKD